MTTGLNAFHSRFKNGIAYTVHPSNASVSPCLKPEDQENSQNRVAKRPNICLLEIGRQRHLQMANLTKRDLVMRISRETGLVQQEVFDVIQKTLDYITEALSRGQDVELRNFGVFEVRLTKSRVGRNPHKPEHDVVIPARATVKFKSGKIMRQRVLLRTEELKNVEKDGATA
jgi:nucleoid DNA-binding protein